MKIDFHTHVKLTKRTAFDLNFFQEIVLNAKESGLTAIAMTEHFNTSNYTEIFDVLESEYTYEYDYYDVNGFRVFTGMEIDVKEVGHILFIGNKEKLLAVRGLLNPHTSKEAYIEFEKLLDLGETFDLLMIGAHPLRPSTPLTHHERDLLRRLHAFDLNGKDMHEHGIDIMKTGVEAFASEFNKPIVYGSDSHHPIHIGVVCNTFDKEIRTAAELKKAVLAGGFESTVSPVLHTKIHAAKVVKKKIKESLTI
jgi:histidinol phosphatase-like PHP family hydrolase